tara:strand:- start:167 stop:664 length:498 start_codon:yes stop_codon:yes gene_type:complete
MTSIQEKQIKAKSDLIDAIESYQKAEVDEKKERDIAAFVNKAASMKLTKHGYEVRKKPKKNYNIDHANILWKEAKAKLENAKCALREAKEKAVTFIRIDEINLWEGSCRIDAQLYNTWTEEFDYQSGDNYEGQPEKLITKALKAFYDSQFWFCESSGACLAPLRK